MHPSHNLNSVYNPLKSSIKFDGFFVPRKATIIVFLDLSYPDKI